MSPIEWAALAAGALGLSGVGRAWWARRALRAHVVATRTAWVRAGRRVTFGPVGVLSYGTRPRRRYGRPVAGAAGVADGGLIFKGQDARYDLEALLATLRYLSLTSLAGAGRRWGPSRRVLAVHFTSPDGWRVAVLASDEVGALGEALASATGLPLHNSGDRRDDFGPAHAVRMVEDVYGDWTRDRARPLYLAPDRLLFGWRDAILLSTIRRLDVDDVGGGALLRVEHETSDGMEAIGFMLDDAPAWAEAIAQRIDVPLQVTTGRKKKKRGD